MASFGRENAAGIFLCDQVSVESMLFYLRYCLHLTYYIHVLVMPKCIIWQTVRIYHVVFLFHLDLHYLQS